MPPRPLLYQNAACSPAYQVNLYRPGKAQSNKKSNPAFTLRSQPDSYRPQWTSAAHHRREIMIAIRAPPSKPVRPRV